MADHELRLTLTQHGITHEVVCTADPADQGRACTYYAVSVYPCLIDDRCFVVDSSRDLLLEELLGQFDQAVDLAPVPVSFDVERESFNEEYAVIEPVVGPECTGVTARWCPVHGDCTCPTIGSDPGDRAHESDSCPLHDMNSPHPTEGP